MEECSTAYPAGCDYQNVASIPFLGNFRIQNTYVQQYNKHTNEYKRIHKAVIEKIVYGSEVAAELEKFLI